jgi:hypothetical protein
VGSSPTSGTSFADMVEWYTRNVENVMLLEIVGSSPTIRTNVMPYKDKQLTAAANKRMYLRLKESRGRGDLRERWIWEDTRRSDRKKKKLKNDLTKEFIKVLISEPCSYCGEDKLQMTLDRIDNTKGHLQNNVLPCCVRCNLIRRDMPFDAWIELTDSLRRIQRLGMFKSWTGQVHK